MTCEYGRNDGIILTRENTSTRGKEDTVLVPICLPHTLQRVFNTPSST